jgi:hypothetical protein
MKRLLPLVLLSLFLGAGFSGQTRPPAEIEGGLQKELLAFLGTKGMSPEDYVVSKFKDHDIVFIGEHHFIKHDVEFVQSLIPVLYRNGITDLGIEFGCYELQAEADALLAADAYDEGRARRLMFKWGSYWPYVEYLDLYKRAWELNRSLPRDAPKFRIVSLDYRPRWDLLRETMSPDLWKAVLFEGTRDRHMARIVMQEFVRKGRKALVYTGQYHAFTRFHAPVFDRETKKLIRLNKEAMGNLVYRKIRGRACNICLHYPWTTINGPKAHDYPLDGAIDGAMKKFAAGRIGFDIDGSPFGRLGDKDAEYAQGRKQFVFSDFCDGYVFLGPFSEYEGCTVDPLFITKNNLAEAVAFLPNASVKKKIFTVSQFLAKMKWDADFKRLYPDLE